MTITKLQKICVQINPEPVAFFDKVAIRIANKLSDSWLTELKSNCLFVDQRIGHHIVGSDKQIILTLVVPNEDAIKFLARRISGFVNYVEMALDVPTPNIETAHEIHECFDRLFAQSRHSRKIMRRVKNGTYTGEKKPGHRFCWYADLASKKTGDDFCFHIEGRHHGVEAVRRIGIKEIDNLLVFDHEAYWAKYLNLYSVDFERLGRLHFNRLEGRKRKTSRISVSRDFRYNVDAAAGRALFRVHGAVEYIEKHTIQKFIDEFGRGPFLRRMDVTKLMPAK